VNRFSEIIPLALTPLTPIHIGCGEDFEPTNYVIDEGVLYPFEPTALPLNEDDCRLLMQSANRPGLHAILAVQQFFHDRRGECRAASPRAIPVSAGVADWYEGRIGRVVQREEGGRGVGNELGIERTAHHPYTGKPYLPGSSIKGSARTGWLNEVDHVPPGPRDPAHAPRESANTLENQIFGGSFSGDPFRLVEFADAADADLKSRVVIAVDRRKRPRPDGKERNVKVMREAIAGGQFRAAQGEIRFKARPAAAAPGHAPHAEKCIGDFAALARACNRFYRARLEADLEVLAALVEAQWTRRFQSLIAALKPALDDGRAMLLRVGRHSGAESVTLDRHRWIRIIGKRRTEPHWAPEATTIWLAGDREDSRAVLRPFGWLLLEHGDKLATNDHLRRWCEDETNAPSAPPGGGEGPPTALARAGAQSVAATGRPSANRAQAAPGPLLFRRGDRVRNAEGEIGRVMSDVKIGENMMTIEIDGDLETVRVTEWKTV
jgi:CRISPR-associated protein Csm5